MCLHQHAQEQRHGNQDLHETRERPAGVAAGVPAELVEITVHKNGDEVRFGWKAMEAPAQPVVTTPAEEAPKVERIEQNGVKRPGPGKCLEVWEYLDQHGNMMPKDLKPIAGEKGWNENNALIELYQWRKFNGITRAAKAAL